VTAKKDGELRPIEISQMASRLKDIEHHAFQVASRIDARLGKGHKWRSAANTLRNKAAKLRKEIEADLD